MPEAKENNKVKAKDSKEFFSGKSVEELNGLYSVISRGNGGDNGKQWLNDIEGTLNDRIQKFNAQNQK